MAMFWRRRTPFAPPAFHPTIPSIGPMRSDTACRMGRCRSPIGSASQSRNVRPSYGVYSPMPPWSDFLKTRFEASLISGRLFCESNAAQAGGRSGRSTDKPPASEPDPLHLVLRQPLLRAIVKLGRAWAFVCGHLLRVLKRSAVREVGCDPGRSKRVTADFLGDARGGSALSDHAPSVGLSHGLFG